MVCNVILSLYHTEIVSRESLEPDVIITAVEKNEPKAKDTKVQSAETTTTTATTTRPAKDMGTTTPVSCYQNLFIQAN